MSINSLTFTGNIGGEVKTRTSQNGKTIATFSVPCTSGYGENKKTSWLMCKIFGNYADSMIPYLTKGKPVTINGEFVLEQWEKDGVKHSMACCVVNSMQLGKDGSESQTTQAYHQQAPQPQQDNADFDDDIPF